MEIKTYCKNCGICCKAIPLNKNLKEVKEYAEQGNLEAKFILDNWIQITKEEAQQINKDCAREAMVGGRNLNESYFSCTRLIDNECSCYEERPGVCKNYPFNYGDGDVCVDKLINSTNCGYLEYIEEYNKNLKTHKNMNLQEKILAVGIENCIFMVPLRPLNSVLGIIKYTSSNDKQITWPCQISEEKYKIKENYKITLEPISYKDKLASETYYLSDLTQLIKSNHIQFYIKQSLTEK